MKFTQIFSLYSLTIIMACGPAAKNDPLQKTTPTERVTIELLDTKDSPQFSVLPLSGNIEDGQRFWSGHHWPHKEGSINLRWNSNKPQGRDITPPTRDAAMLMSELELMELSPAEKFDLFMGRYDFPLVQEVAERVQARSYSWEGISQGWALASAYHAEPKPITLTNADGIAVPFGSSDLKALLSYYYAFHFGEESRQLGAHCEQTGSGCLDDVDAGAFHVLIANRLGLRKQSVVIDIDPKAEVWNHPVVGFASEVLEERPATEQEAPEVDRVVLMKTTLHYVAHTDHSWWPIQGRWQQMVANRLYSYELQLDRDGNILGGKWKSLDRPDFAWLKPMAGEFTGDFQGLTALLKQ